MTTYDNLTVRQFQEIYKIRTSDMTDEDKLIQSLCVLTGLTEREVEEMSVLDINKAGATLAIVFSGKIPEIKPPRYIKAGRWYGINYNPKNTAYYQYSDVQAWIAQNPLLNMHKILASISYPVRFRLGPFCIKGKNDPRDHAELSEAFLDCPFKYVNAICVFFSTLWHNSIKALANSLENMTPRQRQAMKILLQQIGDGYITAR
jgi:hypothetical protein